MYPQRSCGTPYGVQIALGSRRLAVLPEILPLHVQREGNHLRFGLLARDEILPELPADYERFLEERLAPLLAERGALTIEIHLEHHAGVSSRELGALITLQRVLRRYFDRIPVTGLSDNVRHVLNVMGVGPLFDLS